MSDVLEKPDVVTDTTDGNHDKFSHYCRKEDILTSAVTGEPIRAVCGKLWIPSHADGKDFPICPECKDIYDQMRD